MRFAQIGENTIKMNTSRFPRIMIAGLSGDSGKTMISCGLLAYFREKGLNMAPFKKGPDYIDSAWLEKASGVKSRNLDTYMVEQGHVRSSFLRNSISKDISLIEGNRGLYDGFDAKGSHSSAELAKLLKCPIIIVLPAVKVTRTTAAIILGCKLFDNEANIAGVIINNIAGSRHEKIIRDSIESETGIPVIGSIPKISTDTLLPSRHLGLITPVEYDKASQAINEAKKIVGANIDCEKILNIANSAPELNYDIEEQNIISEKKVKIGVFKDKAFSFYYNENIEALEKTGAEIVW
ncbi:MAG: cobyrinic acid a,c-diamide synthase, partial [Bacteroidota bacterium]|nr:cobyrinic acid a,c-diamide synthase [Bacteroidota bacterium]